MNRAIALDVSFVPAYIEKTKILISTGKLEQASENSLRTNSLGRSINYEALRLHLLVGLLLNGVSKNTLRQLNEFVAQALRMEPPNPQYYFESARLFSRLSDQSTDFLEITGSLLLRACEMENENGAYRIEYAHHTRFAGKYDDALEQYMQTLDNNETSADSIVGLLICHVVRGETQQAKQQLEFLSVLHEEQTRQVKTAMSFFLFNQFHTFE